MVSQPFCSGKLGSTSSSLLQGTDSEGANLSGPPEEKRTLEERIDMNRPSTYSRRRKRGKARGRKGGKEGRQEGGDMM